MLRAWDMNVLLAVKLICMLMLAGSLLCSSVASNTGKKKHHTKMKQSPRVIKKRNEIKEQQ